MPNTYSVEERAMGTAAMPRMHSAGLRGVGGDPESSQGARDAKAQMFAKMFIDQFGIDRKKATELVYKIGFADLEDMIGSGKETGEIEKGLLRIGAKEGIKSGSESDDSDPEKDFKTVEEVAEALRKKKKELEEAQLSANGY